MQYYSSQLIYRIFCAGVSTEQYEEQWRLIIATDERAALEEARRIGNEEASTLIDRHGRTVEWQLIAVKDLREINLENGTLLFSTIKEVQPIAAPLWSLAEQE